MTKRKKKPFSFGLLRHVFKFKAEKGSTQKVAFTAPPLCQLAHHTANSSV
jgi:hypothetical protein